LKRLDSYLGYFQSPKLIRGLDVLSHYLKKHGKNTKHFKSSYRKSKSHKEIKIIGNIFGESLNIHHQSFTICITMVLTLQDLLSESGTLNAQTR
jgi:hypothetical protein